MEHAQVSAVIVHEQELAYMELVLPNVPIWRMIEAVMNGRCVAESKKHVSRLFDLLATTIMSMYTKEIATDFDQRIRYERKNTPWLVSKWSRTVASSFPELKFASNGDFYGKSSSQVGRCA